MYSRPPSSPQTRIDNGGLGKVSLASHTPDTKPIDFNTTSSREDKEVSPPTAPPPNTMRRDTDDLTIHTVRCLRNILNDESYAKYATYYEINIIQAVV